MSQDYTVMQQFIEQIARLIVPGDDDETMVKRVEQAQECAIEYGDSRAPVDDAVLDYMGDDGFFESEIRALWALVRKAREVLGGSVSPESDELVRLRESAKAAWAAVRARDEETNVTVKKLREELVKANALAGQLRAENSKLTATLDAIYHEDPNV